MKEKKALLKNLGIILVVLGIFISSCDWFSQPKSAIVARVGKAVLTIDDLNESIPPEYSDKITNKQRVNFVKQWIDTELLYQAALHQKIHKEQEIRDRLERIKKDLLGAEMISRNSVKSSEKAITEEDIVNYYEQHKGTFIRESNVVKYQEIVVTDLKTGWQVRNTVTPNNFSNLASQYSIVPIKEEKDVPYVPVNSLPEEISDLLFRIRIGGTTSPVTMEDGVHIFRILDKKNAGDISLLEEVREEIVSILSTLAQKQSVENMLADLRQKTDYEIHFNLITTVKKTDSTSTGNDSTGTGVQ